MPADIRLGPIGQILVPVSDVERATAFYRDVLGLPLLFAYPGVAFFDADGVRLYLAAPEEPSFEGRATIYFRVDDVAAAADALAARGAPIVSPPHVVHRDEAAGTELWMAFSRDPDGNNVALMAEVKRAA